MVLAYIPWLHRPMLYAHMSLLYSLYIAALVSMLKGELTNVDGIFTVVTAGSPASIYLWYLTLRSFWNVNVFPIQHADKSVPANKSLEVQLTRAIALGSFFFEFVLIGLMFIPTAIKFSQPKCNERYGSYLWYNIAWQLPVAIQSALMLILFFIALGLTGLWTNRRTYKVPAPRMLQCLSKNIEEEPTTELKDNIDIISWTEQVLFDCYPQFMNRTLFICLIAVVQLSALPDFNYIVSTKDCLTIILMTFGLFREMPRTSQFKIFVLRICIFLFLAGVWVIRYGVLELFPNSADWVIFFIGCTSALWSWSHFSTSNMKIFLPALLVLFSMIITTANVFIALIGDPKIFRTTSFRPPDGERFSFFSLNILTVVLWIICWLGTSNWPRGKSLTWDKFNKAIWRRAHLLKFCWIILGPHILWIQASNNSNPSRPTDMTFGQIFALIVSTVTIFTLLDEAREMKKEVWAAFFQSDLMPSEEKEQPKHYVPVPGLVLS
ncbi:hypothetical protein H1R20_g7767, partial [Candolleomyces eurysporus]